MIDGGILLILIGIVLMALTPIERAWAHRKHERAASSPGLFHPFPFVAPDPAIDELRGRAEAAISSGALPRRQHRRERP